MSGDPPDIVSEKWMRAMRLQLLFGMSSEHRLFEQISENLMVRLIVKPFIEDSVLNQTGDNKSQDRLIGFTAAVDWLCSTVEGGEGHIRGSAIDVRTTPQTDYKVSGPARVERCFC